MYKYRNIINDNIKWQMVSDGRLFIREEGYILVITLEEYFDD